MRPDPPRSIGLILLSLWLLIWGFIGLLGIQTPYNRPILLILAIAAGFFLLLGT